MIDGVEEIEPLYKVVQHIPESTINRLNAKKSWEYGYNKEYDLIIISKTGQIGEVYEVQNLRFALPKAPSSLPKKQNKWVPEEYPEDLKKIKSIFEWEKYPKSFRAKWLPYIDEQFDKREIGHWFMNNGVPTYICGNHWMYLQWTKIDVGLADFREANRIFFLFWEACVADDRCYGIDYVKIRRSGFSFMGANDLTNTATISSDSRLGILSKTGADAKSLFSDKVVPISNNYPFFFKPIQAGMDKPKTELAYRVPASKITRKSLDRVDDRRDIEGLDTSIDWKSTGNNSYDGEKLLRLLHDESGKWEKPNNVKENWRVTKTCLRLGRKIIGKCMMGSTVNPLDKGGQEFKDMYEDSDVTQRNKNGQTKSGLYSLFIPMEWNTEGFIDEYGMPVLRTPEKPVMGVDGVYIEQGVIDFWENEAEGLKNDQDALNEFYRQFPRKIEHAFRDSSKNSLFTLQKIYEQIDYNDGIVVGHSVTRGNFQWENGIKDTTVRFTPSANGRFYVSWIPERELQNNKKIKGGMLVPGNEHIGAFGCDSYDISGTVDGRGSKGALHGLTKMHMDNAPTNMFFLEYVSRPPTAEIFFEDVLMAIVFYGMPILAENNKPRLLYHLKRRGYRGYSMNRPDKTYNNLGKSEKEVGGIPSSGTDMIQAHAAAIETYINDYVGLLADGSYGNMYFNRTLQNWAKYDITNRTFFDATISSGFAIMACNRHRYSPKRERQDVVLNFQLSKYQNKGVRSKLIN